MQGVIGAIARLVVMGAVTGGVVVAALVAGLGATTAIAVGIVLAGVVGLIGVVRRPRRPTPTEEIDAMLAADPLDGRRPEPPPEVMSVTRTTRVESMAPQGLAEIDPEANMPRWRRPSLLEARHSDPTRRAPDVRMPMRFGEIDSTGRDVRVVRYAVVPVLDRPDEVLGIRLSDLGAGDEVQVVGPSGAFFEVLCPSGDRGFVHRTTLGPAVVAEVPDEQEPPMSQEADDALAAVLTARGLI